MPFFRKGKFVCDYNLILENIKELNALANEGEQTIVESKTGATFQPQVTEKIRLVLYENGICVFNGPFREFTDPKTQQFCKDIMDGYFPTELQSKYPDGVPFEVTDKREVYFKDKHNTVFQTEGYRLGTRNDADSSSYMMKKVETDLTGLLDTNTDLTKLVLIFALYRD